MEPEILLKEDYAPLKVKDRIISSAALHALAVLGDASVRTLVYHMSSLTGMKEQALLASHSDFEKAVMTILGRAADIILRRFSDELAKNVRGKKDPSFNEILAEIEKDERIAFLRNMRYGEQVLLLYKSDKFRDAMMSAFFDPVSPDPKEARAVVVLGRGAPLSLPVRVASTTYEQLQALNGPQAAGEKVGAWAASLCKEGKRLRFASDNTWLAQQGFDEPPHGGVTQLKNAAVMCAYDLEKIGPGHATKVAAGHSIAVLEGHHGVYAKK